MSDAMREALAVQVAQAIHNIAVQDGRLGTPWTDKDKPAAAVRDTRLGQADAAIELVSRALAPQPAPKCKVAPGWHLCADSCAKVGECLHAPKSPALDPATVEANRKLAEKLDAADFLMTRDCPMVSKFDHENVDVYLSGEEQNLIVRALLASPAPSGEPSHSQISQLDDASNAVPCKNCDGTKRALYFSEQNWSHEIRACHLCAAPSGTQFIKGWMTDQYEVGASPPSGEPVTVEDIATQLFAVDGNGFFCDATPLQREAYTIRAKAVAELYAAPCASKPASSTGQTGNDLASLRQAIIDHTHGDLFWIGEILLSELEKETGFTGAVSQTDSKWRTDFEDAPSPCLGWCTPPSGDDVRQIWRHPRDKSQWTAHSITQTVKAWQPLPTIGGGENE